MNKILNFENSALNQEIKEILKSNGFTEMTDIQHKTIPHMLNNKDIIVRSQTGTGKTLSFVLPILHNYFKNPSFYKNNIVSVVISPTRELSLQITGVFDLFEIKTKCFIGGTSIEEDLKEMNSDIKIVVGTPGRLLEVMRSNTKLFSRISYLILDEADRLISLGFKERVLDIVSLLPKIKSCGLFSATINDEIKNLSKSILKNPVFVQSEGNEIPSNLCINYMVMESNEKLFRTLELVKNKKSIVFFSTCNQVDFFYSFLVKYYESENNFINYNKIDEIDDKIDEIDDKIDEIDDKIDEIDDKIDEIDDKIDEIDDEIDEIDNKIDINIYKIHRKMKQEDRNEVYKGFYEKGDILLCTDIAARGIDFKNIDLVIHFDIPNDYNNIIHRSGRTARNGSKGSSILYIMPNEKAYLDYLKIKELKIEEYSKNKLEEYKIQKNIRNLMDDTLYDLSVRAFVAYFRSYKEHTLTYLLDYTTLDYDNLVDLYMLKKIPGMTELRNVEFKNFPRNDSEKKDSKGRRKRLRNVECKNFPRKDGEKKKKAKK
jgi:superfamily II DNA/RNA helicase